MRPVVVVVDQILEQFIDEVVELVEACASMRSSSRVRQTRSTSVCPWPIRPSSGV